jgi:hypothetical protein
MARIGYCDPHRVTSHFLAYSRRQNPLFRSAERAVMIRRMHSRRDLARARINIHGGSHCAANLAQTLYDMGRLPSEDPACGVSGKQRERSRSCDLQRWRTVSGGRWTMPG